MPVSPQRIVVGISGATGFADGVCALRLLRKLGLETHLVVSRAGDLTREYESDMSREQLRALADVVHPIADVGSLISSGSFKTIGMLVAPCSIRTLSRIAVGTTDNPLTPAANEVFEETQRPEALARATPLYP